MNTVRKVAIAASLALTALFAVLPASAARHPLRHASRLDRRANRAAYHGHFRRSAHLRREAGRIRRRTYMRRHRGM